MSGEGKSEIIASGVDVNGLTRRLKLDESGNLLTAGGGGGDLHTAAKGATAAGFPTSTDVDANRQGLDVFIIGGAGGGGGPAQLQIRNAGDTAWVNIVDNGSVHVPVDIPDGVAVTG